MSCSKDVEISIDLEWVQNGAERAVSLLQELRETYELTRFEFTDKIRIAPLEIPHSHPVLTLNTRYISGDHQTNLKFLSVYLHEQFHWGLCGLPDGRVETLKECLRTLYPGFHKEPLEGARDEESSYLHLIVNWLEFNALSQLIGMEEARQIMLEFDIYTHIYQTVVVDYEMLQQFYSEQEIYPLFAG